MPLYEYECARCGERTESIQRHGDALLTVCPHCGGALAKLLSAPAFQFKGSGFHVTDYGKSGEKKTGEKETSSSKGEEGRGASESKGAGPGESKKEDSSEDSSEGKKVGGADAAPAPPTGSSSRAPSKKKDGETK